MSEDGARAATTVIAGVAFAVSAFAASLAALRAVSTTRDPFSSSSSSSVKTEDGGRRAALVLIAHPDDESYFFAPTVQALKRANVETHLVSRRTYDAEGKLADVAFFKRTRTPKA